jgi:hypothetical protein
MTLIVRPGFQFDTDASTYIEAVEVADAQALETATRYAINNFVIGCKQDGIWSAIKASCILSGARTMAGALIPLAGTAPTNNNFVSGDYNRKTGLGDASNTTKYLNSNRDNNADPQNSKHASVYLSSLALGVGGRSFIGADPTASGRTEIEYNGGFNTYITSATSLSISSASILTTPFMGVARAGASLNSTRVNGVTSSGATTSSAPTASAIHVFGRNFPSGRQLITGRLAFYSIGESLDLALLDARVSALITAFGVAIP